MPYKLVRTEAFEEDLLSALEYLFEHSGINSVRRLMDEVDRKAELLAFNPFIFAISRKAGLRNHEFREAFAGSYTILYRIEHRTVYLLRFLHQSRDMASLVND